MGGMASNHKQLTAALAFCDKIIATITQWIEDEGKNRRPDWKDEYLLTVKSAREQIEARLEENNS
jgi:hypothetical protein